MDIPEVGRQIAHTLLDAVSAHQLGASHEANANAMTLALDRLTDIEAIHQDEQGDIDASDLVGAALTLVQLLVLDVARARGVDPEVAIADARMVLDH